MKLPPFELERYFALHEFTARYLLCSSDCESVPLKDLLDLEPSARTEFEKVWLGYTESLGHPKLRQEISALYETLKLEHVMVHAGAEEAIFNFMHTMVSAGDHIIVHWPCYQSLFQVAESIGCSVTKWEANPNRGWELDIDFLKKSLKPNTKAVVLNSPHNPTGYLMEKSQYLEVVRLLDSRGIILFMDEVYKGLEYDKSTSLPSACDLSDKAVSLGVLSKAYGLAGLRIGWIGTKNQEVFSKMADFKDYTTICNSAPSEYLSILALTHKEKLVQRNKKIIQDNISLLDVFFRDFSKTVEWVRPKAGCISFPRLKTETAATEFCETLIKKTGVLLAPGSKFGFDDKHFRLGFGRKNCPEALSKLSAYLEKTAL